MTSNNRMLLTLGVAGVVLLSIFGKSMKTVRDRDRKQAKKELTTWEGEGGSPKPTTATSTNPPVPPTAH